MRCKKCGAELIVSDNFCRVCGAKADLSDPDVNSNNTSTSTANVELEDIGIKKVCKKTKFWISIGLIALFILMMYISYTLALSSSKNFSVEKSHTETSRNEIYDNFKVKTMSYKVPQTWKTTDKEPYRYHYDTDGNMLMVYFTETDSVINDLFFDGFIKGFIESEDTTDIIEQAKEYTYISGKRAFHYVCTCKFNGKDMYMNIYGFIDNEIFYTFLFGSFGDKQSSEFDEAESKIINSLVFDNDYVSEEPTNPPTEKQTEPTTKKPTEPPTEKPTERKIRNNTSTDGFWAEGNGDYVANGLKVTGYGVLHIEYYGEGNFSVISYENDEYDDLLVNTIGNYSGDVLIDHSGVFELEVSAKGNWKISSSGLSIDDTTSFSGSGDSVTGLTSHSGGTWEISHNGNSNFSVVEYGLNKGYMDLLVNEIGDYSGTVKAESGDDIFFKVNADGKWSIKKK